MNCKTILLATVAQAVKINQESTDFPLQGDSTLASVLAQTTEDQIFAQTGAPVSEEDCDKDQNMSITVNMDEVHHYHSDDDNSGNEPPFDYLRHVWEILDHDQDGQIIGLDIFTIAAAWNPA